jgi:hypothetical protein
MISSPPSLRLTLDAIDEALFYRRPLTPVEREEFTLQILSRQMQAGPRAGMFSHGAAEREGAPRLFSGERLHTLLAAHHSLLIDSTRILTLLGEKTGAVTRAIELANLKMETRCYAGFCAVGECRHLTIAFMRYLIASQPSGDEQRLGTFFSQLSGQRDGQGRWGSFPFYYTLLMLSESDHLLAARERQYAAPACAALRERPWKEDSVSERRRTILEKAQA